MRVLVYADELAQEWRELIGVQGHEVIVLPPRAPVPGPAADICLVAVSDPLAERFWMIELTTPFLLGTHVVSQARVLCGRAPYLRLICHSSRAASALGDMLHITREIQARVAIFGPLSGPVQPAERGRGGLHAIN